MCCEDPAALDLQDWFLNELKQFIDGVDLRVGNSESRIWVRMGAELVSLLGLLPPYHQGQLS